MAVGTAAGQSGPNQETLPGSAYPPAPRPGFPAAFADQNGLSEAPWLSISL